MKRMQKCAPTHAADAALGAHARLINLLERPGTVGGIDALPINAVEFSREIAYQFAI